MGMYHVSRSSNGSYYWTLRGDNGERILQSETYTTKGAAFGGVNSCKSNSGSDGQFERLTAGNGQPYFVLRARNNEIIATSETYSSSQACEKGIEACKRHGPTSGTKDDTDRA